MMKEHNLPNAVYEQKNETFCVTVQIRGALENAGAELCEGV